jgi:hypothetical protein
MREERKLLLWTEGLWRCEYRNTDDTRELRLYHGADIRRSATVMGGALALATATGWRALVLRSSVRN